MLKIFGVAALGIICFLAALIIPMAVTGNLNEETITRLFAGEQPPKATKTADDNLGSLAASLRAQQERLDEWDTRLAQEAVILTQRESIVDETLTQITQIQTDVAAAMDALDTEQQAGILSIAKTMAAMTAQNAAIDLEAMSPEEAARILPLIKDRNRGKILDVMNADRRSLIIQVLQERKY